MTYIPSSWQLKQMDKEFRRKISAFFRFTFCNVVASLVSFSIKYVMDTLSIIVKLVAPLESLVIHVPINFHNFFLITYESFNSTPVESTVSYPGSVTLNYKLPTKEC